MAWPQLDDFRWAIQNPQVCFADPVLKSGQVVCDKFGQPKMASGNFACAYEIRNGGRRWAVRTFNHEVTDQQRRYQLISAHLGVVGLPYIVNFQYLPQGILVQGAWYPAVKMAWVEGMTLTRWVREHLNEPDVIRDLAKDWRGMVGALYGLQMAHADLQQGNVLVTPSGELKLIDYDGMYVPAMHDELAPELGHPNWNHPKRTPETFGPYLDQFPGLVGYLSLLALTAEPVLLDRYCNDDNLILSHTDFVNPDASEVLQNLKKFSDSSITRLANAIIDWCARSVDDGTLESFATGIGSLPRSNGTVKPPETESARKAVFLPSARPRMPSPRPVRKPRLFARKGVVIAAVSVVACLASALVWFFTSANVSRSQIGSAKPTTAAGSSVKNARGQASPEPLGGTQQADSFHAQPESATPMTPLARSSAKNAAGQADTEPTGRASKTERKEGSAPATGAQTQSTNVFANTYYEMSRQREQKGDLPGARASLDQAIALDPKYGAAYNSRGVLRRQQGDLMGARIDLDKAINLNPKDSETYNSRGLLREQMGDLAEARADYDRAIALNSDEPTFFRNRGNLRRQQGDLAGARTDLDQAIAMDPKYSAAYNSRAVLRRQQGDLAGARADYDQAITINPDEPTYFRNRGNLRRQQRDLAGARADYDQAITLNPKDSAAYNARGVLREQMGDLAGARADYDQAITINPNDPTYFRNRGNLRRQQGDLSGARADLDKALALSQKTP